MLSVPNTTVLAATGTKINSVPLSIESEIEAWDTDSDVTVSTSSSEFDIDDVVITNEPSDEWDDGDKPKFKITLYADDDYYFTSLGKDKITLKGGAEYKSSTRQNSSSELLLDVNLPSLQNSLKSMEGITLSDNGIATWPAISTAGSYEVRVYREGKIVGTALTTDTNSANCRIRMMKPNENYMVKVRAVNKYDNTVKGEWTESNTVYISGDKVAEFKADPNASNVNTASGTTGKWKQETDKRWWYCRADGTYPANQWEELGGKWYFFDENGYMKTGWIDWNGKSYYCSENGDMLTDCMTPDNYLVGADGAWIAQ